MRNWESRAFQIAKPRHIAFAASVGSLFGEMCCHDVVYFSDSCTSFVLLFVASVGSLFGETVVCVISLIAALRSSSSCLLNGMRYIDKYIKYIRVRFQSVYVEIKFAEAT